MSTRIPIKPTIIELDCDNPARSISQEVKNKIVNQFLDLKIRYFDLSKENLELTNGKIETEAAEAIEKDKYFFKCSNHESVTYRSVLTGWLITLEEVAEKSENIQLQDFCNAMNTIIQDTKNDLNLSDLVELYESKKIK